MKLDNKETEKLDGQSKDSNDSGMKMMMGMMILCCAIPLIIFVLAGGGLGFWFGRSTNQPVSPQPTSSPQPLKN
jgi:flagellar basal body-associated protein FliL